jgi:hypothetical protein
MLSEMGVDAAHWTGRDVASMLLVSGVDVGSSVLTNVVSGAGDRCGAYGRGRGSSACGCTPRPDVLRRQSFYLYSENGYTLPRTRFGKKQSTASGPSILPNLNQIPSRTMAHPFAFKLSS